MSSSDANWSIRSLLNPVVARLLINGVNAFDVERALRRVENTRLLHARQLESVWLEHWEEVGKTWQARFHSAVGRGSSQSARDLGLQAAGCRLAQFLINPGSVDARRAIYLQYVRDYRLAADHFGSSVLSVQIPLVEGAALAALLHLPKGNGPHPCAVVFAGLGSCKEEMNPLARLLVDRGVAALVPDMPGSGESLFHGQINCGSANLTRAFDALVDFVAKRSEIDPTRFGATGLCMGGGYAYRACYEHESFRWCAPLFPLFINSVGAERTPSWMKSGEWYDFQTGGKSEAEVFAELGWRDAFRIACPLFMVHGKHDNWMSLDCAQLLYEHAESSMRQLVVIDEEPVFSTGHTVTHTMPVGEQMGWVGPLVADWIAEQAGVSGGAVGAR